MLETSSRNVYKQVTKLRSNVETQLRKSLHNIGKELKATAKKDILAKPKGGLTYRILDKNGKGRRHVASKNGESWANKSGRARKGIQYSVKGSKQLHYFNRVPYVAYLEDPDTLNRRAMWNSIKANKALNIRILKTYIKKGLKDKKI